MKRLIALFILVAIGFAPQSVTHAGVRSLAPLSGCYGSGCTGKYASSQGCAGTVQTTGSAVVRGGFTSYGTVYVRYSPICNAKWAQYVPSSNPPVYYSFTWISNNSGGGVQSATCAFGNCTTPMVGGGSSAFGETDVNLGIAGTTFSG